MVFGINTDAPVYTELEGGPDHHVDQQDKGGAQAGGEEDIETYEEDDYAYYRDQDIAVSHACPQELVVDMVLVWKERVAAFPDAVDHHTHDIEQRYYKGRERYDHAAGSVRLRCGGEAQPQHYETQDIPEGQAACVSHEELVSAESIAEDVVEPERNDDPEGRDGK